MSQVTPVIDSGYHYHRLQPLRPVNYLQCSSSSAAWSTPNLTTSQYSSVIVPRVPLLQTFQSPPNQYDSRSMALTSKLPSKKTDQSRIPAPGCNLRASGNTLRSKINSNSHNGLSSQSSLVMVGRENARRSTSPQVSSVKLPASSSTSSSSSSSLTPSVSSKAVNANITTSTSSIVSNGNESRIRRTPDKSLVNNCKLSIRPPRPTSIPSVEGKCSTVNGKNVINKQYLTTGRKNPAPPPRVSQSQQQQTQQQQQMQSAPLKEFMANRRIVETSSPLSSEYSSKIATIAPSSKVFTSVTYSNASIPASTKICIGKRDTDKVSISTDQLTSVIDSLKHLQSSPVQSTGSSSCTAPPVTPRKPVPGRREGCVNTSTVPAAILTSSGSSNVQVKSSKGLSVDVQEGEKKDENISNEQSEKITMKVKNSLSNCSLLSLSSSSLSPSSVSSDSQNQCKSTASTASNSLSTFTITSSVSRTSPPVVASVDSKLTPHTGEQCAGGREDKVKSTNGPGGGGIGGSGGGGGGDGDGFDRINVLTCKPTQSVELDDVSTRPLFSFINASNSTTAGQNQLSTVNGTVNHSQGKSIHVYPFIRGETASSTLGALPMSSLLHSLSTRRLDKIANVNGQDVHVNDSATDCIPAMSLTRSSFNLTGTGSSTYTTTSPISFSSNTMDGIRSCDIESLGVKFPSMRNLVTPPPTPFGGNVSGGGSSNHLRRLSKNSDLRGSAASLLSGSSNFSSAEEKQVSEIKRLKSELNRANEKVATLSTQLVTSSQMVSAFDQSLSSMANRMHQINLACEHKDRTIDKLSRTIEELRKKESAAGGGGEGGGGGVEEDGGGVRRGENSESAGSGGSAPGVGGRGRMYSHSVSSTLPQWSRKSGSCDQLNGKKVRMRSCSRDRSSSTAVNSLADSSTGGWIRQSISRAFRKSRNRSKSGNESGSDGESFDSRSNLSSVTDANGCVNASTGTFLPSPSPVSESQSPRDISTRGPLTSERDDVTELKLDVEAKERALTDLRLESLSMAHQMDSMKESMVKMKAQIDDLLSDNLRLQLLLSASGVEKNSLNGHTSTFSPSPVTSCDQLYSQNSRDPLMIALKRLQDATAD